ncbi:ArsR/SmtB-type metalloregulator TsoR [Desulfurivibrio dismutans]|uniref:ArsR/SmtB-type metalloregulator TsoR n=1 Tax=Desulfurivibrio dismutans TaxID=1398908 RepID=UPI0023D9B1AD|nr:metalloregulator ArsR/SmtB family transcription factor [Desulfurivibrio alkaliphilus]MDF1613778.1 metalloregulator ArsR/SmtB family transcription factor [Desulfurivibrio alkaliphilus]
MKNGNSDTTNTTGPDLRDLTALLKGLADENRLRLLLYLAAGEKTVSSLVAASGLSQPLVSHHLKELRRALLVEVERRGPFVFCRLADPRITALLEQWQQLTTELVARRHHL